MIAAHAGLPQAHFSIQTSPRSSQPRTAGSYQGTSDHEHQFHPCEEPQSKIHAKPTQTAFYGNCIYPGCPFPKYVDVEEGKVHDFCSKSCATNFAQMQAAFHQQKVNQQGHGMYAYSGCTMCKENSVKFPCHFLIQSWQCSVIRLDWWLLCLVFQMDCTAHRLEVYLY